MNDTPPDTTDLSRPRSASLTIVLKATHKRDINRSAWAAEITSKTADGQTLEKIVGECDAKSQYDVELLGAICVLDYVKRNYSRPKSIVVYGTPNLTDDIRRTSDNGGQPTGQKQFWPMLINLHKSTVELGARIQRCPKRGAFSEIAGHLANLARSVIDLGARQKDIAAGIMKCPTDGCDADCYAYRMTGERLRIHCRSCNLTFFLHSPEPPSL